MSHAAPIPTIDVAEAERRLREDPAGPILLDVREVERVRGGPRARRRPRPDVAVHDPRRRAARPTGR